MKILSIAVGHNTPEVGKTTLFGVGDDNKVYIWDATIGGWRKNWNEPAEPKTSEGFAKLVAGTNDGPKAKQ